jgi:hypothetical protein
VSFKRLEVAGFKPVTSSSLQPSADTIHFVSADSVLGDALCFGASNRCVGLSARAYKLSTSGMLACKSLMRVAPAGWVLSHCGGAPLLAAR